MDSLDIEARMIRGFGSKRDYELIRAEDQSNEGVVRRHSELQAAEDSEEEGQTWTS
ncbi:MAG: hypothetical protein L0K44_08650 [Yaniella sp.]|nr:hypothetical protein [Yaniella sp.]